MSHKITAIAILGVTFASVGLFVVSPTNAIGPSCPELTEFEKMLRPSRGPADCRDVNHYQPLGFKGTPQEYTDELLKALEASNLKTTDLRKIEESELKDQVVLVGENADSYYNGSGSFFTQCHIITDHHVVENPKVKVGAQIGKKVKIGAVHDAKAPFKKMSIYGEVVGLIDSTRGWNEEEEVAEYHSGTDLAVIRTKKFKSMKPKICLPEVEPQPDAFAKLVESKSPFSMTGHPAGKYLDSNCNSLEVYTDKECYGTKLDLITGALRTNCQSTPGMSGGPVYLRDETKSCYLLLGIVGKGNRALRALNTERDKVRDNTVVPINQANYRKIQEIIRRYPCED